MSFIRTHLHLVQSAGRSGALVFLAAVLVLAVPAGAAWENGYWATVFTPTYSAQKVACEDGQGGTIVAMYDASAPLLRIRLSRLAPDGTELWGDGGVAVPFDIYSDSQQGPIDVASDGAGGAYIVFREIWGSTHYMRAAHFAGNGSLDWDTVLADLHYQGGALGLRVVSAAGGDAILVWPDDAVDLSEPDKLLAMRVDGGGSVVWTAAVNQVIDLYDSPSAWDVAPDGSGGVLVGWNAYDSMFTLRSRIQRITAGGTVLWGSDGHLIAGWVAPPRVLPDGSGGAYAIISDDFGLTYGQHLNSAGGETWVGGGILLQDADTYPNLCTFDVCISGGALHLVQGVEDLHVQRVDINGNLLWGTNGLTITSLPGWQDGASIASDGLGGVLVAYLDHYYSQVSDPNAHALSVTRLNSSGGKIFEQLGAWFSDLSEGRNVDDVDVVGNGSGGGHLVWLEGHDSSSSNEVYAMGVGPAGVSAAGEGTAPDRLVGPNPFPNPFNPLTTIAFSLPSPGRVRLGIYDLQGRRIVALLDEERGAGEQHVTWDGRDGTGDHVASGVYLARLEFGGKVLSRKLVLTR
jgi:hypothetical protein